MSRSKSKLSDYDFDQLGRYYDAHKRSDFGDYVSELANDIQAQDARFPSGYQRVQLEALRAADGRDLDSAIQGLRNVELSERDFPWLNDVVLIHTARCYWKAGRKDEEGTEREKFLKRQLLLFEPDHAYGFSFLDYQEQLRPLYQNAKGGQGNGGTT